MKKISIITVVKNGMPYLKDCIKSFKNQNYQKKEQIIVVSKSNDGTYLYLKNIKNKKIKIFYEKKKMNIYQAINFGIKNSTGQIIGILHSDDIFYKSNILNKIVKNFSTYDVVYGNIKFSKKNNLKKIIRSWKSSKFKKFYLNFGWMPPHTSIFIKRKLALKNLYDHKYKISADYDFILKIFQKNYKIRYINLIFSIMRYGGVSTDIKMIFVKLIEDLKIAKKHFALFPFVILCKIFIKIPQFFKS